MGAWGHKSFENDGAMDWLDEFMEEPDVDYLASVFANLEDKDDYLDSEDGCTIVAAAELVAIATGRRSAPTDVDLSDLDMSEISSHVDDVMIQNAISALESVKNVELSELAELWEDSESYESWLADINSLISSLRKS
jgi:uncharacterized UBP type Zn finger protein